MKVGITGENMAIQLLSSNQSNLISILTYFLCSGSNDSEKEELTCHFPTYVPSHEHGRLFLAECQVYTG